jgi:hypothetical protein
MYDGIVQFQWHWPRKMFGYTVIGIEEKYSFNTIANSNPNKGLRCMEKARSTVELGYNELGNYYDELSRS